MRYVTHYKEYPIYEPAEGGYYYAGNEVSDCWKLSKRAAKKMIREIYKELITENESDYHGYPLIFMSDDGNRVEIIKSGYIGDTESWVIERKLGSQRCGRVPYC